MLIRFDQKELLPPNLPQEAYSAAEGKTAWLYQDAGRLVVVRKPTSYEILTLERARLPRKLAGSPQALRAKGEQALSRMALGCVLYPNQEEVSSFLESAPVFLLGLGNALCGLVDVAPLYLEPLPAEAPQPEPGEVAESNDQESQPLEAQADEEAAPQEEEESEEAQPESEL